MDDGDPCNGVDDDCDGRTDEGLWCWSNPFPAGFPLHAAWCTSPNDGWAVGDWGGIVRWNGSNWSQIPIPSSAADVWLADVWGSGPVDAWAVGTDARVSGRAAVLRWNGESWSEYAAETAVDQPTAVWGSSRNDVWIVGSGTVAHWDGTSWSVVESGTNHLYLSR